MAYTAIVQFNHVGGNDRELTFQVKVRIRALLIAVKFNLAFADGIRQRANRDFYGNRITRNAVQASGDRLQRRDNGNLHLGRARSGAIQRSTAKHTIAALHSDANLSLRSGI